MKNVNIEVSTNGECSIMENGSGFSINTNKVEDYPTIPDGKLLFQYIEDDSLIADAHIRTISRMASFKATEDYRPSLNGILYNPAIGVFYATNGHILARFDNSNNAYESSDKPFSMHDFSKVLNKIKNITSYSVYAMEGGFIFWSIYTPTMIIHIISRLIDGSTIDCERVIPKSRPNKLIFNKATVEKLFALYPKNTPIYIKLNGDIATFSATDYPSITEKVISETPRITGNTIGFNISYLKNIYEFIGEDNLTLYYEDPTHASTIINNQLLALIMPVRVPATTN
jgi:DNA polymerase III sliding clamp (beta) subunit (PCNA family)